MAADGTTTPPDAGAASSPAAPHTDDDVTLAAPDAVRVAAPGELIAGLVKQDEVPLTQFPNGMRRTVRLVYDVSHGDHHPFEHLSTDDVRVAGVETAHAVHLAYGYLASAGALNDLVTVRAPSALDASPFDAQALQDATQTTTLRHLHKGGLLGQSNAQSLCGDGVGYPSPALRRCAENVCSAAQDAVRAVLQTDGVDGAMALTRPVGSRVSDAVAPDALAQPTAYAALNAVTRAVRAAWDAGARRVGIVSMQTWYPAGLARFVRDAPPGAAFLAAMHPCKKAGAVARDEAYGPTASSADAVLNMQLFTRGAGGDAMVHAARDVVLPALTAYDADVLIVVCGEQNTLLTYPVDVRMETEQHTWAVVVQELMAACPKVVVLTDALLRPNRCSAALLHVMYALQGRAFPGGARRDDGDGIRGTIVGKLDVHLGAEAYARNTATDGAFAAVQAAMAGVTPDSA